MTQTNTSDSDTGKVRSRKLKKEKKKPDPVTLGGHSAGNLELIEAEILRQRDSMRQKMSNTYTRATVLIGAAGVLGGVGVGVNSARDVAWGIVTGVVLNTLAAVCGLVALRPMSGEEVNLDQLIDETRGYDPERTKRTVLWNNLVAHADYERSLKNRTGWIVAGLIMVVVAFTATAGISGYEILNPGPGLPTKVEIVK
jgi:hypothetical protein